MNIDCFGFCSFWDSCNMLQLSLMFSLAFYYFCCRYPVVVALVMLFNIIVVSLVLLLY